MDRGLHVIVSDKEGAAEIKDIISKITQKEWEERKVKRREFFKKEGVEIDKDGGIGIEHIDTIMKYLNSV